ncbi:MAG: PIN domain-containing protein [Acidimicrobiales bacterium]
MNLWLLDASILLASEDPDDQHHGDSRRLLEGSDPLATLDLVFYEVTNVAVRSWHDHSAARRLRNRVTAVADDGGLVRADAPLLESAAGIADENGISVYDAAYVAAARALHSQLVSCDVRDLVSRGLALLPGDTVTRLSNREDGIPG